MRSTLVLVLIGTALLAGCASAPKHDPNALAVDPLAEAQHALASGDFRAAEAVLGSDPARLEPGDARSQVRVLLLAELALQRGEDDVAADLAGLVQAEDAEDPRATELLGKVALRKGRFGDAGRSFESARIFYTLDDDRQRASDLLRVAEGLAAYSEGDVSAARGHWSRIQGPVLREQFDRAYASVVGAESD